MDEFFKHENLGHPPSISDYGKLRKATNKDDFIECLPELPESEDPSQVIRYSLPPVDALIIDGPAMVQSHLPRVSKTFGDYCKNEIGEKIKGMAEKQKE